MDTPKSEDKNSFIEEVPAEEVKSAYAALESQGIDNPTTEQVQNFLEGNTDERPNEKMVPQEIVQKAQAKLNDLGLEPNAKNVADFIEHNNLVDESQITNMVENEAKKDGDIPQYKTDQAMDDLEDMGIDDPTPEVLEDYLDQNMDNLTEKTTKSAKQTLKEVGIEPNEANMKRYQAGLDQFLRNNDAGKQLDLARIKKAVRSLKASGNKKPSFEDVDTYLDNLEKIERESKANEAEEEEKDDIVEEEEVGEQVPEKEVQDAINRFKKANGHEPDAKELGDFLTKEGQNAEPAKGGKEVDATDKDAADSAKKEVDGSGDFQADESARYDFMSVRKAVKSLTDTLGREPTNQEVFDKLSEANFTAEENAEAEAAIKISKGRAATQEEFDAYQTEKAKLLDENVPEADIQRAEENFMRENNGRNPTEKELQEAVREQTLQDVQAHMDQLKYDLKTQTKELSEFRQQFMRTESVVPTDEALIDYMSKQLEEEKVDENNQLANGLENFKKSHNNRQPSLEELEKWMAGEDEPEKPTFDKYTDEAIKYLTDELGRYPEPYEISEYLDSREDLWINSVTEEPAVAARASLVRQMLTSEERKFVTDEEILEYMNDHPLLQSGALPEKEMDIVGQNLRFANGGREPTTEEVNSYLQLTSLDLYPGHLPLPGYTDTPPWFSDNMLIFGAIVMMLFTFWQYRKKQKKEGAKPASGVWDNLLGSNDRRGGNNGDDEYR